MSKKNLKTKSRIPRNDEVLVMELNKYQWQLILDANARWQLLEIVEQQGFQAARDFVKSLENGVNNQTGSP